MTKLTRLSERIYVLPYTEEADRPNLFYLKGDVFSVAIDAGNSAAHVQAFYDAISAEGLPLPLLTVITHWHWDHTFGLHAVKGHTLASERTNEKLCEVARWVWTREAMDARERTGEDIPFCSAHIRVEYPDLSAIVVQCAAASLYHSSRIDAGNLPIELIVRDSPHSRDALLLHLPTEHALFVSDADCEDFYHGGVYDPARLSSFIEFLERTSYERHFLGHAEEETKAQAIARLKEALRLCGSAQ